MGAGHAWAETSTLTFTAACGGSGTADDGAEWLVTSDAEESSYLDSGIHYGTNKANVTYVQLSTSDISGTITQVVVNTRDTQATATVSVTVGGTAFTCSGSSTATNTSADYTFTGSGSGEIIVKVDRGSSMSKAIYVKSVAVTYSSATSYELTAISNNENYGTVSATGNIITADPKDGYRVSTTTPYEVTVGTATVTQSNNEFTVSATADCTVKINFEAIPKYAVTIEAPTGGTLEVKNGNDVVSSGDEFAAGTELTVTATPDANHNFRNWQAVDATTHTYTAATTYTMTEHAVTLRANFDEKVFHNVNWSVNGTISTNSCEEGTDITFPADPTDVDGKTFVGWVAEALNGTTDEAPSFVTSATMGNTDVTYYAVFATKTAGTATTVTDALNRATTGVTASSYSSWTEKKATSDAVYAGQSAGGNSSIQLKSADSTSGIVTTTSGGKAKKVLVEWNSNTQSGRTLDVYGKSAAYDSASDLYDDNSKGTKLGSIVYGTSTELTITGDYSYIGLRSNSGAMWLTSVSIDWETGTPDTYSEYCTTVAADNREKVNITSFSATSATLLAGNTTTTTVENDQNGWTAAYTYSSDDETVATVSNTGVITGVGAGTTNIKVTLNVDSNDENYKAGTEKSKTVEITVNALKTPQISPNGGKILAATSVTISSEDGNAVKIYYSTDGTTPSLEYTGAFNVEPGTTVKAVAKNVNDESYTSSTAEAEFKTGNVINLTTEAISFVANTTENITFPIGTNGYQTDDEIEFSATNGNDYTWEINDCMNSTTAATKYYLQIKSGGYAATSVVSPNGFVLTLVSSGTEPTVSFGGTVITKANGVYTINAKSGELKISGGTSYVGTITLSPILPETYTRDVTVGNFGTMCVPFGVDAAGIEGATFYTISGKKMNGDALEAITLEEATSLTAGVGYIFKATDSQVTLTSNFTSVDTPVTTGAVIGTFDDEFQVPDNMYILSSNKIYGTGTTGDGWIRKNRAYIDLTNVSETNEVKGIALFNVDVATGIDTITSAEENDVIFNMAGQRVKKPVRGLYIINGKKVFVK